MHPKTEMALTDTKLRNMKPKAKPYQAADGGGLFIHVLPGGKKTWRMQYRLHGKHEKVTLGEYPHVTLLDARRLREETKGMLAGGI